MIDVFSMIDYPSVYYLRRLIHTSQAATKKQKFAILKSKWLDQPFLHCFRDKNFSWKTRFFSFLSSSCLIVFSLCSVTHVSYSKFFCSCEDPYLLLCENPINFFCRLSTIMNISPSRPIIPLDSQYLKKKFLFFDKFRLLLCPEINLKTIIHFPLYSFYSDTLSLLVSSFSLTRY